MVGDGLGSHAWVDKTRAGAAQLVRTAASATATPTSAMEYLHEDHLGSLAAATDATGASLLSLAHDPYGMRRGSDWTAALPAAEMGHFNNQGPTHVISDTAKWLKIWQ